MSALLFSGRLGWLRRAWRSGRIVPVISEATTAELLRVLTYPKFQLDDDDRRELLGDYLPFAEVVMVPDPPPDVPEPADGDDRMFLELAVVADAELLVTGDPGLLAIAGRIECPIISPADARSRLRR